MDPPGRGEHDWDGTELTASATRAETLPILGWREWVGLPELGIPRLKAKVDTGARTSTLHAYFVERFDEGGRRLVRFGLHPRRKHTRVKRICVAEIADERTVSDSGGHREKRIVIRTPVVVGAERWSVELTLTARDSMLYRMLFGRTAIRGRYLVDAGASWLAGRPLDPGP